MGESAQYREWQAALPLRRHVACTWAGRLAADGTPYTDRVLPDGSLDLVWDGVRLLVAGPDTGPVPIRRQPGAAYVGLRFRPGLAPTFLGVPAAELVDQRVAAADVLGDRIQALVERLRVAPTLRAGACELERELLAWLPEAAPGDTLVEAAVAALADSASPTPVARLAGRLGVSERQLHRRCTAWVGYSPKTLHRVLRFRRFMALAGLRERDGLADLAAAAGYADQAHLSRDCQRLAGAPPGAVLTGVEASDSFKPGRRQRR